MVTKSHWPAGRPRAPSASGGEPRPLGQLGHDDAERAADGEREPEVDVRVVEAGDDGAPADVDDLGAGAGGVARGGFVVADVGDLAVDDGERRGDRLRGRQRERVGVGEHHGQDGDEHAASMCSADAPPAPA